MTNTQQLEEQVLPVVAAAMAAIHLAGRAVAELWTDLQRWG